MSLNFWILHYCNFSFFLSFFLSFSRINLCNTEIDCKQAKRHPKNAVAIFLLRTWNCFQLDCNITILNISSISSNQHFFDETFISCHCFWLWFWVLRICNGPLQSNPWHLANVLMSASSSLSSPTISITNYSLPWRSTIYWNSINEPSPIHLGTSRVK